MLAIEDIVSELRGGGDVNEQGMPPGFRFHPTDEELITFYLASKVYNASSLSALHISEVDLTRCEPWELPGTNFILFYSLLVPLSFNHAEPISLI